jgi:hypothetical protein
LADTAWLHAIERNNVAALSRVSAWVMDDARK